MRCYQECGPDSRRVVTDGCFMLLAGGCLCAFSKFAVENNWDSGLIQYFR